jgi:L-lactate utilization protein LutB
MICFLSFRSGGGGRRSGESVEEIKMFPSFNQEETNLISTVDRIRREVMTRVMEYLEHVEEKIENRGIDYHTVPYL